MLVYKLDIDKLPQNCLDCTCHWCTLPFRCNSHGGVTDMIKKKYRTQRHEKCPIVEVKEEM